MQIVFKLNVMCKVGLIPLKILVSLIPVMELLRLCKTLIFLICILCQNSLEYCANFSNWNFGLNSQLTSIPPSISAFNVMISNKDLKLNFKCCSKFIFGARTISIERVRIFIINIKLILLQCQN